MNNEQRASDERKRLLAQAKLGLDALIDEATGYQERRPADELAERYRRYGGKDEDYRAPDFPPDSLFGGTVQ